ncbi:beta-hexosaminidase [Streptomyces sp. uw30]|uniref:beta-N-acetylhexosaminidase n=1 Tax=Streptomyces sp. uw30 TaxID=1828179 RepID=UPI0011CE4065|nr:beta-N-acetylhexosaminidase [Streptomyces sp. uw30]TXS52106.1 beta-hexosaminidase [Streptomyces sp. uw30]
MSGHLDLGHHGDASGSAHDRAGHFTFGPDTCLRISSGAEPAAQLLRTVLAPATGLPLHSAEDAAVVLALDPALSGLGSEGYGLTVGPHSVLLRAAQATGLLRGVQTIRQLLPPQALAASPQRGARWSLPCVEITDVPRHRWRGAMLDVARHFQPVSYLRRYVDLLALHKINVFHLHLTDDQGWRMPISAYPKLTEIGAHRARTATSADGDDYDGVPHGGAYTRAELTDLVQYAAARGITVMPEIEMPGHVRAALAAYPHLGNRPDRVLDVWTRWGVCDTVLGVHEEVFDFCRTVLEEVMDVFPSPYIHIGGDECPLTEWEQSPQARARAPTYFDYPQSSGTQEQPAQPGAVVALRDVHAHDPVPEGAAPEAAARILGTQAQLWTEYAAMPSRLEYLTYPRLCALADRAWGGPTPLEEFRSRLARHTARLDALGVSRHPGSRTTAQP